jgi:nicotinate-nucleotide adenylyltransferase
VTGIYGAAFDPPHVGHVALLRDARARFDLEQVVLLVSAAPGHKEVVAGAPARLALARLAFPGEDVELDPYPRTVDMLRARRFDDPLFLLGADEFCDFLEWKDPDGVIELTRLGIATRPGFPQARLDRVLRELEQPDRVEFFEIEALDVSSTDVRDRVARGEPIDGLVPPAVAAEIERLGLYRGN